MNMQLVNRGDEERRDIDAQVQVIDQQLVYLNAQLAQMNPSSQIFTSTGERVMSAGDRLKVLRSDYERSAALYNPEHPDVVRLKRLVDGLERSAATPDGCQRPGPRASVSAERAGAGASTVLGGTIRTSCGWSDWWRICRPPEP